MQRAKRTQINYLESQENMNYLTISGKECKHVKETENIKRTKKIGTEERRLKKSVKTFKTDLTKQKKEK